MFKDSNDDCTDDSVNEEVNSNEVDEVIVAQDAALEANEAQVPVSTDLSQWMSNSALQRLCWTSSTSGSPPNTGADDMFTGQPGISSYAMDGLKSPLQAFLLQLPLSFWDNVS